MCGIFGVLAPTRGIEMDRATAALGTLAHRGPDGRTLWISDDRTVALGHHRLSIVDPEGGEQPVVNEVGDVVAVVNGEFYEHQSLRKQLEATGHVFRTRSDSEVLVHLYETIGTECVHRLRGEFAFLLWDSRRRTLLAGRDRFGIKPLVYAEYAQGIVFASEVKALFRYGLPARWDREQVIQKLHIETDGDRTLFDGVMQVPPGSFMVVQGSHRRKVRYWNPALDFVGPVPDDETLAEEVRALLVDAVRVRFCSEAPTGVYLSGGIDSSAVAGIAAEISGRPLDAYTVAFDSAEYDEAGQAAKAAAHWGARAHILAVHSDMLADNFASTVIHSEQLVSNGNAVAKFLLSGFVASQGIKVVLTGEGSDEIFGGYPSFVYDSSLPTAGIRPLTRRERVFVSQADELDTSAVREILGYVPAWIAAAAAKGRLMRGLLDPEYLATFESHDPYRVLVERALLASPVRLRDRPALSMHLWRQTRLPNLILSTLGDRVEMAHGIEGRLPYLDHRLAEYALRIPSNRNIRPGIEKYILRAAARPFVPADVVSRPKEPFLAPSPRSRFAEAIKDILADSAGRCAGIVSRSAVVRLVQRAEQTTEPSEVDFLWRGCCSLASLFVLEKEFRIS